MFLPRTASTVKADDHRLPVLKLIFACALFVGLFHQYYAIFDNDLTYDERSRVHWVEHFLEIGEASRENIGFRSGTPVLVPSVIAGRLIKPLLSKERRGWLASSRCLNGLWLLALISFGALLARGIAGPAAGYLAGAVLSLEPITIGLSSVITADLPFACLTLGTIWASARWGETRSTGWAFAAGVFFGSAAVAKVSAAFLAPVIAAVPLLFKARSSSAERSRRALPLAVAAAVCGFCLACCAWYFFRQVGEPLAEVKWRNPAFASAARLFPRLRLPLPTGLLTSFDELLTFEQNNDWRVYVLNAHYDGAVWFHYPLVFLLKTPLPLLIGLGSGLVLLARSRSQINSALTALCILAMVCLGLPFLVWIDSQHGVRYILAPIVLLHIIGAASLARLLDNRRRIRWCALSLAVVAIDLLPYAGNPIAYTNSFVIDKKSAYRLIAHSSIEWGQKNADAAAYVKKLGAPLHRLNPHHLLPGDNWVSHNLLAGVTSNNRFDWARKNIEPLNAFRFSILHLYVEPLDFLKYSEAHLAVTGVSNKPRECARGKLYRAREGRLIRLEGRRLDCIYAESRLYARIKALCPQMTVEVPTGGENGRRERMFSRKERWFLLSPGYHVLEIRGQRPKATLDFIPLPQE